MRTKQSSSWLLQLRTRKVIDDKRFEVVNDFVYLGSIISNNFGSSTCILQCAASSFFEEDLKTGQTDHIYTTNTSCSVVWIRVMEHDKCRLACSWSFRKKDPKSNFWAKERRESFKCKSNEEMYQFLKKMIL